MTAAAPDRRFAARMRVNGVEDPDLYRCIESITVDEDLERGSSFAVKLTLHREEDGSYTPLDDDSLRPWSRVTLLAAFPDQADVIMDGYISHLRPSGGSGGTAAALEVLGVDASYAMNLEEKCRVWSKDELGGVEPTFEEIARTIIESYGLEPVLPEEAAGDAGASLPAVAQRGTDHAFLRELARRKGYEFYVRGGEAHFHAPQLDGAPQKLIAYNFGPETNCSQLDIRVDGTRPTEARMTRIDPMTGEVETATATASDLPALGTRDLSELRGFGLPQTRTIVRRQGAASLAQMNDYVRGVLRRNGFWVVASGTLNGQCYGRVLRSKKLVTIKGFGESYNGLYYVRKVQHRLEPRSYEMQFEAHRNRLGQLGSEDFQGELPSAVSLPVAVGAGAADEVVTVRESGGQVAPA